MKKNYYTIHKNKKKRKDVSLSKTKKLILAVQNFIKALLSTRDIFIQTALQLRKPHIPNYKKGGTEPFIVGSDFGFQKDISAEVIRNEKGVFHVMKPDESIYKGEGKFYIDEVGDISPPQDFSKSKSIEMFKKMVVNGELEIKANPHSLYGNYPTKNINPESD